MGKALKQSKASKKNPQKVWPSESPSERQKSMDLIPKRGTASEVGGDISDTMDRKKQIDSSTVISSRVALEQ